MRDPLAILLHNIQSRLLALDKKPAWLSVTSKIARGNLSKLLAGEANPTLSTLTQIAKAFGVEPWELLRFNESLIGTKIDELYRKLVSAEAELAEARLEDLAMLQRNNRGYEDYGVELVTSEERIEDLEANIGLISREIARLIRSYPSAVDPNKYPLPRAGHAPALSKEKQQLIDAISKIDDGMARQIAMMIERGVASDEFQDDSGT